MENEKPQEEKIVGYRKFSEEEISAINEGKELAETCGKFIDKLEANETIDKDWLHTGKRQIQQGFMAVIRSIGKPNSF